MTQHLHAYVPLLAHGFDTNHVYIKDKKKERIGKKILKREQEVSKSVFFFTPMSYRSMYFFYNFFLYHAMWKNKVKNEPIDPLHMTTCGGI